LEELKIVIAGFGGQGVVLAGNLIARGCMIEGLNVTGMVSYGVEMRGGTANSTVIISDGKIASPVVDRPGAAIILNQPSLDKFEPKMEPGSVMIVNTTLVKRAVERDELDVLGLAATKIAKELGSEKVANIVALGAFLAKTNVLKKESVLKAVKDLFTQKKPDLVELNLKAFEAGFRGAESELSSGVNGV
jgi:2-oxoglutarate ferredoxin oxidoreductase subunit gamma